jgi:hypothetical protein
MVVVPVAGVAKASTAISALPPRFDSTHRYIKRKSGTLEKGGNFWRKTKNCTGFGANCWLVGNSRSKIPSGAEAVKVGFAYSVAKADALPKS